MGFTGKREMASCCPSSLRMEQGDASLNYRVGFRLPQRVSSLRGAGRPDLLHARRGHHLQVTFPRVGARQRRWSKAGPSKTPSPLPSGTRDPGTNGVGGCCMWKPPAPVPRVGCLFLFPNSEVAARLFSANEPARSTPECGFGVLLFFSHPSCF